MFRRVGCSMKLGAKSAVERKDKLNFLSWWGKCEKPSHCISSDKHHLGKQSGFHQFSVSSPRIFFFAKKAFVELAFVYLEKGTGLSISLCWFCLLFIRKQTEKKRSVSCFNASFGWSYRRRILKDLWLSRNLWKHSYLLLALLHECTAKRGYFSIEWSRIRNLNVWFFFPWLAVIVCLSFLVCFCCCCFLREESRDTILSQLLFVIGERDNSEYNVNNTYNRHNNRSYRL